MTNREIVEIVYREFNVIKSIEMLISETALDKTSKDLASYIYQILLKTNNRRLNHMFNSTGSNRLKAYIRQIILNNRNYYRSWLVMLRKHEGIKFVDDFDNSTSNIYEETDDYEERLEKETLEYNKYKKVVNIFKNEQFGKSGLTEQQNELCISISILGEYLGVEVANGQVVFIQPLTMKELSNIYVRHFKNGRSKKMEIRQIKKHIDIGLDYIKRNVK